MANQDVRDAQETLNAAIQALDSTALKAAEFDRDAVTSSAYGARWRLGTLIELLQDASTTLVAELESLKQLETR